MNNKQNTIWSLYFLVGSVVLFISQLLIQYSSI